MTNDAFPHVRFKLWVCEVEGCGYEYQLPADTGPYKWRGRIVCNSHRGDPAATEFVADAIVEGRPVVNVETGAL